MFEDNNTPKPDYNNQYDPQQYNSYYNQNNFSREQDEHVKMGEWIGIFCINLIPCVGTLIYFVMLFVWSFGKTNKKSLKTFAQAQLVYMAIAIVLVMFIMLVSGAAVFNFGNFYDYH